MWSYEKEINKIKALNLSSSIEDIIVSMLEHKLPESFICPILNQYLAAGEISQKDAYKVIDILGLIDEECLEDCFIVDDYDELGM